MIYQFLRYAIYDLLLVDDHDLCPLERIHNDGSGQTLAAVRVAHYYKKDWANDDSAPRLGPFSSLPTTAQT